MKTDLSYDDLYRLLQEAYKGMWAENMSCPWCGGYISGRRQEHYKDCDILKVPGIRELIRQLNKERREWEKKRDNLWTHIQHSIHSIVHICYLIYNNHHNNDYHLIYVLDQICPVQWGEFREGMSGKKPTGHPSDFSEAIFHFYSNKTYSIQLNTYIAYKLNSPLFPPYNANHAQLL